ncbi:MAG TPA: pyridoxine 5'-phosphate synthase [Rickettsiales bacterium]|nr:pyridoxine 5'-phosphate synthase [Rickettsiales bacterium]
MEHLRLGINIDHVATVRNARGGLHPDPVRAAHLAAEAGADGITAHLREDRRHIRDADIERLMREIKLPLNFEMAATQEMQAIALKAKPHAACIVPEKRQEVTTEGGLDVIGGLKHLKEYIKPLRDAGIRVSLFVDPVETQIMAAAEAGAQVVELHTGKYCEVYEENGSEAAQQYLTQIQQAARAASQAGLECHAGHGLSFASVGPVAAIPQVMELNIGHFIVGEAIFIGLKECIGKMRRLMQDARK